jgi:hypothetical protein
MAVGRAGCPLYQPDKGFLASHPPSEIPRVGGPSVMRRPNRIELSAIASIAGAGRCKAPAVRGWKVCRCHGAGGGAPRGEGHGMYKHGGRTIEATELRRALRLLLSSSRDLISELR